jgi:hypothetical protein
VSVKALDHDMQSKEKLILFGILAPKTGALAIRFGSSHKTSDFVTDYLTAWCAANLEALSEVDELVIDYDNGPESNGRRTQFLKCVAELADLTGKRIHLVHYLPYHSKCNPIERCRATLERHWCGTLLSTAEKAVNWAKDHDVEWTPSDGHVLRKGLRKRHPSDPKGDARHRGQIIPPSATPELGHRD